MENLSHESDEEESISQAKRVNSSIMMNEYKDNEIDTELITSEKDSAYKESHFYALLLFMNILNGVFREKQDLRNTFEKINWFR